MKKIVVFIAVLFSSYLYSSAQIVEPVKWKFSIEEVNAYEVKVVAEAVIEEGWKTYGSNVAEGGPVSTSMEIEKTADYRPLKTIVEVVKAKVVQDPVFDMEVPYFKHKAKFTHSVRIVKRPCKVKGFVRWMSCNDTQCTPPTEQEFELDIK